MTPVGEHGDLRKRYDFYQFILLLFYKLKKNLFTVCLHALLTNKLFKVYNNTTERDIILHKAGHC